MTKRSMLITMSLLTLALMFSVSIANAQTYLQPVTMLPSIELDTFIARIVNWLAGLIAIVCVLVIIVSVYAMIFGSSDDKQAVKARNAILGAVIGLIIVLAAWAIVRTILNIIF